MATKKRKPRRFNEGDLVEAADKDAGLKTSKDERVGFAGLGRFLMGNIDDPNSEAYRRFGAGRAKADRARAESKPSTDVYRVDSGPGSLGMSDEDKPSTNVYRVDSGPGKLSTGATKVTPAKRPTAPAATRASASGVYRVDSGPGKLGSSDEDKSYTRRSGATAEEKASYVPRSNYSNEGRGRASGKASVEQIPTDRFKPVSGERVTGTELSRNAANTLAAMGPGKLAGVGAIGMEMRAARGAGDAAKKASDSASRGSAAAQRRAELKKQAEEGIERNLKSEFQDLAASAAKSQREKVTNPLAWMSGPKNMADDFKRGGKVKAKVKKMASGGSTSGASKRADGIAQRGKTRGRIY
jgi:hypothetical protein